MEDSSCRHSNSTSNSSSNRNSNTRNWWHSTKLLLVGVLSLVHFASIATSFEVFSPFASSGTKSIHRPQQWQRPPPIAHSQQAQRAPSLLPLHPSRISFAEDCQDESLYDSVSSSRRGAAAFVLPRRTHTHSHTKLWLSSSPESLSSSQEPENNLDAGQEPPTTSNNNNPNVGYDDLYEFLTRRTGEEAGESERRRKRDRIREFMGSSSSSSTTSASTTSSSSSTVGSSDASGANLIQPLRMEDGKVDEELVNQQKREETTSRTKVRFDSLFSGMPSLDEIISRDPSEREAGDSNSNQTPTKKRTRMTDADDFSWFEPERLRIEQEYDAIRQETKARIREQRLLQQQQQQDEPASSSSSNGEVGADDGDAIPDNAENIADAIVTQEMNRMINSVQVERAKERLQDYEMQRNARIQSRDYQGASDDVVDQIFKETAENWELNEKLRLKEEEYQKYERMRQQQAAMEAAQQQQQQQQEGFFPTGDDTDMDDWTLDRLEEMLEKSQNSQDDNGSITDILEENIEELRKQIERESKKGSIEPQTMKEWQMYRSIATRLAEEQQQQQQQQIGGDSGMDALDEILSSDDERGRSSRYMESDVDETQVANKLKSWRELVEKEERMRRNVGLSSVPKLPFDYLGTKMDQIEDRAIDDDDDDDEDDETKNMSRRELRRQVNIQAVQAMEDLIRRSDSRRTGMLKKQLEELKAELESNDYNDIEDYDFEEETPASVEPVDLTGVFTHGREEEKKEKPSSSLSSEEVEGVNQLLSFSGTGAQYSAPPQRYEEPPVQPQAPPDTPFFSEYNSEPEEPQAPVPNTPFFQDQSRSIREEEVVDTENKLGSVDEQKLQAMFRKANARTKSEQDKIRKNWEDFQAFEKGIREKSGLSAGAEDSEESASSSLTDGVDLGYDVQDVMTGDGDFDAEKILSTIGPRPTRKKKPSATTADVNPSEVEDAIYRSVAAAGGGRGKDDDAVKEKDRAEFDAYLAKEQEMKRDLDGLEDEIDENTSVGAELVDIDIDDPDYAEENLGPRPVVKPKRKEMLDERELSDMGGVRANRDDGNDEPIVQGDGLVPDWLRKEREEAKSQGGSSGDGGIGGAFLGSDINEVFDDDQYDKNLRQLHEYEQRRAGKRGQMGIDISDVLGRRGSDDYVDYTYDNDYFRGRQDGWGDTNFEARKAQLLDYIELDPSELNNLMAHRDSAYATGASQYLPRINRPFKEFGAIFRLEGVLIDITGLQQKVWNRIALEFNLKEPLLEDVQRAAVLTPDAAVKELFFTSMDDFVLVRRIVDAYRRVFREEFDAWARGEGIIAKVDEPSNNDVANAFPVKGSLALGFEEEAVSKVPPQMQPPVLPADEGSRLRYLQEIWNKTAKQFRFPTPTNEQIAESSILTPDIAVRDIFCWSEDQTQINKIVAAYSILQAGGTVPMEEKKPDAKPAPVAGNAPINPEEITEDMILELQYMAWEEVAEENALEVPDPEEILAAAVLNNPEMVVVDGFGWTEDPTEAARYASRYRSCLTKFVNDHLHNRSYNPTSTDNNPQKVETVPVVSNSDRPMMPTDDEILSSQLEAWKETARAHDFDVPPLEQIQSMSKLKPKDGVRQMILLDFDMDDLDPEEAVEFELTLQEIIETYTSALEKSSKKYLAKYKLATNAPTSGAGASQKSKEVSQDEIYSASFDAWTSVAWKYGFPLPVQQEIQFALTVGPKEAILGGFCWTESEEEADEIAEQYLSQIKAKRDGWIKKGFTTTVEIDSSNSGETEDLPLVRVMPDVTDWIKSLQAVEMGCGVVTHLEDDQMNTLLEFASLSELMPLSNRVSNSNGYLRDSQQLLGVSLRIERRPDQCVVFDTSPAACVAAHEYDMRSVALVGAYPRYELLNADTSASSVDELTALNIRRLFGERVYDQPELDTQIPLDTGRQVKTKTQWAGDE